MGRVDRQTDEWEQMAVGKEWYKGRKGRMGRKKGLRGEGGETGTLSTSPPNILLGLRELHFKKLTSNSISN